jgi:hypothetical protein
MTTEFLYYIFVGILQELDDHGFDIKFFKDYILYNILRMTQLLGMTCNEIEVWGQKSDERTDGRTDKWRYISAR